MGILSTRELIQAYYNAWANQDRDSVRDLLADDLDFRSAQDRFNQADEFLNACWRFSDGIVGVNYLREIYSQDKAFVVLNWMYADGSCFIDAEYLCISSEQVCEILVVNNSPSFAEFAN
jgi:hypothetical protein